MSLWRPPIPVVIRLSAGLLLLAQAGCMSTLTTIAMREALRDKVDSLTETAATDASASDRDADGSATLATDQTEDGTEALISEPPKPPSLDEAVDRAITRLKAAGELDAPTKATLLAILERTSPEDWPVAIDAFAASLEAYRPTRPAQPRPQVVAAVRSRPGKPISFPRAPPESQVAASEPAPPVVAARPESQPPTAEHVEPALATPPPAPILSPATLAVIEAVKPIAPETQPSGETMLLLAAPAAAAPAMELEPPATPGSPPPLELPAAPMELPPPIELPSLGFEPPPPTLESPPPLELPAAPLELPPLELPPPAVEPPPAELPQPPLHLPVGVEPAPTPLEFPLLPLAPPPAPESPAIVEVPPPPRESPAVHEEPAVVEPPAALVLPAIIEAASIPEPAADGPPPAPAEPLVAVEPTPAPPSLQPALAVRNVCFVSRVRGWGVVDRFPEAVFRPGQAVIVYFELDAPTTRQSPAGYSTSVDTIFRMLTAEGHQIGQWDFEPLDETCLSPRRDYFARYFVRIPETAAPGPYRLELMITDAVAGVSTQTHLDLEVRR